MNDTLWDGRKFRMLNILDDFNQELLHIETDLSLSSLRVIRVLEYLREFRGLPKMIRVDNGPEFISHKLGGWCKENKINLVFIQPGKPTQNAYVERCNGNIRRELLNAYVFHSLDNVREKAGKWMNDYNNVRPHKSLGYLPPIRFTENKESSFIHKRRTKTIQKLKRAVLWIMRVPQQEITILNGTKIREAYRSHTKQSKL